MRRRTHEDFLAFMQEKHPTLKLLGKYTINRQRIETECLVCGYVWMAYPTGLHTGYGCPKCGGRMKKSHEQYVVEMAEKHPTITVLGTYDGNKSKVDLECKVCGHKWAATPNLSLRGQGCPSCSGVKHKTTEEFSKEVEKLNLGIKVIGEYVNNRTSVECICERCGRTFMGNPKVILQQGYGCTLCSMPKGEVAIYEWLKNKSIEFAQQKKFDDCKDKHRLPFDFYIPSMNTIIEYDGIQHYKPISQFGGDSALAYTQRHDSIKTKYCEDNEINLIRIPYCDLDRIDEILTQKLAS